MARKLAKNLYDLVRDAARTTSVDGLRRRGRRTVSVLSFREIESLIDAAVASTLQRRGVSLEGPGIGDEVRLQFLALLAERDELELTIDALRREKRRLERNRRQLADELTRVQDAYRDEQDAWQRELAGFALPAPRDDVAGRLRALLDEGRTDAALRERAVALVGQVVERQRELAVRRAHDAHQVRAGHLRRRIDRLEAKLGDAEGMLARAQSETAPAAVAGRPAPVGPDTGDPKHEAKASLLSDIFRLNVELREALARS